MFMYKVNYLFLTIKSINLLITRYKKMHVDGENQLK